MATDLLRERLPEGCHLGVTQDGRVFFVDDNTRTTSWLHPVSGEPVLTGLNKNPDLPKGWEEDVTNDGIVFYVDHNRQITIFHNPVLGPDETARDISSPELYQPSSPSSPVSVDNVQFKRGTFKQRSVKAPSSKRNPDAEVIKSGWLQRLETSGLGKSWKKRWCVLADFALFIYKGEDESVTLNSVLLPSYRINPCTEDDNIKRNFVFKVEHENTKTLYFATEDPEELNSWMSLLRQAAMMNGNSFQRDPGYNMRQNPMKSLNKSNSLPNQNDLANSYTGYGDPAESPLIVSTAPFHYPPHNLSQQVDTSLNHSAMARNSTSSLSSHSSQNRNHSLNPNLTKSSLRPPEGFRDSVPDHAMSPAGYQQKQPLRDGFAPDSARNSLAQSDSSRTGQNTYSPIQAERQRSMANKGKWVNGVYILPGDEGAQRDSYSDVDTPVKMLHKWDEGFPIMEADRLKHTSYVELIDSGKHRPVDTFNVKSKSHENFSTLPESPPQPHNSSGQVRPGLLTQQGRPPQSQDLEQKAAIDNRQHREINNGNFSKSDPRKQIDTRPFSGAPSQGLNFNASPQHSHQSQQSLRGSVRDNREVQQHQQQFHSGIDRRSLTSNSSTEVPLPGTNTSFRSSSQLSTLPRAQRQPESQLRQDRGGNGHTYVNIPSRSPEAPGRPPYPSELRPQIVKELAETKSPFTQNDFLTSSQMNIQRMQQPPYFQYPTPRDKQSNTKLPWEQTVQSRQTVQSHDQVSPRMSSSSRSDDPGINMNSQHLGRMDPEAQRLRLAYEHVSSLRLAPDKDCERWITDDLITDKKSFHSGTTESLEYQERHQVDYRSSRHADVFGKISPPMGLYHKIPDEPEDLYQRGSAFRPPSISSGSVVAGIDSLKKLKHLTSVQHTEFPYYDDTRHNEGYVNYANYDIINPSKASYDSVPDRLNQERNFSRVDYLNGHHMSWLGPYPWNNTSRHRFKEKSRVSNDSPWVESRHYLTNMSAAQRRQPALIHTVKEDPNMSDREVLETNLQKLAKKNPLTGPRLRMSISAGDLIGKTHDELVLFLIQLRRNQAALENMKEWYKSQQEQRKPMEMEYRRQVNQTGTVQDKRLLETHQNFLEARAQMEEIENKLEVYKPIINLLDNMVTMGSLYGGDNLMLATQYRKHLLRPDQYQPPKKMLEFSRQNQEDRLIRKTEAQIKQLSSDEVDLEEKIDHLNHLDRLLQEQSFKVSSYKEDKELMERALNDVFKQQNQYRNDPHEMRRLTEQQRTLEKEISWVIQQLAEASKELEETTAQNNKLEHEVALLRTKVHGDLNRSKSTSSLASENNRAKMLMEKELAKVEGIMQGLSEKGASLSQAMKTIRRSSSSSQLAAALDKEESSKKAGTYLQTDLDSGEQIDLAGSADVSSPTTFKPSINHQRQNAGTQEDWDIENADENTKNFFGLLPKDKPKGLTVRDVKRQAEQRKEKERLKKDGEDEIKLQVSNVDNEGTSVIHARIMSDPGKSSGYTQWESSQPLYENLPKYSPAPSAVTSESQSAPGSRRTSLILMAPKPFTPYQEKTVRPFHSELALNAAGNTELSPAMSGDHSHQYHSMDTLNLASPPRTKGQTLMDRNNNVPVNDSNPSFDGQQQISGKYFAKPYVPNSLSLTNISTIDNHSESTNWQNEQDPPPSAAHIQRPAGLVEASTLSPINTAKPWLKSDNPKWRHLTISSSEPLKLEMPSVAGDLIMNKSIDNIPDIVKSSQTKMDQIDTDMIDREILFLPEKVLIPERYDADADAEKLTAEDQLRRSEKAERIKKVLASQSLLSISQQDLSKLPSEDIHSRVEKEKNERAHYMNLHQELARQVSLHTKKQAAQRRKTWSGDQFAEIKRQYEKNLV